MLETLDHTNHIGSTQTFLYFDLYLYSAYAAHYVYLQNIVMTLYWWRHSRGFDRHWLMNKRFKKKYLSYMKSTKIYPRINRKTHNGASLCTFTPVYPCKFHGCNLQICDVVTCIPGQWRVDQWVTTIQFSWRTGHHVIRHHVSSCYGRALEDCSGKREWIWINGWLSPTNSLTMLLSPC